MRTKIGKIGRIFKPGTIKPMDIATFDKRKDIAPAFRGKRRRVIGRARANCPRIGK